MAGRQSWAESGSFSAKKDSMVAVANANCSSGHTFSLSSAEAKSLLADYTRLAKPCPCESHVGLHSPVPQRRRTSHTNAERWLQPGNEHIVSMHGRIDSVVFSLEFPHSPSSFGPPQSTVDCRALTRGLAKAKTTYSYAHSTAGSIRGVSGCTTSTEGVTVCFVAAG